MSRWRNRSPKGRRSACCRIERSVSFFFVVPGTGVDVFEHSVPADIDAVAGIEPAQERAFVVAGKGGVNAVEDGVNAVAYFLRRFLYQSVAGMQIQFDGVGPALRVALDGDVFVGIFAGNAH